jgi:hypothetical protein
MAVWEYKVITSGKGGFASPNLLESFLNQLGKEEWEIIHFQSAPDNPLAFTGIARRSTQRDWTLEDAVATAARAETDKLRAEFEAKFKGQSSPGEEKPEAGAPDPADEFRRPRDTERDLDPDADEAAGPDEWESLASEEELPTFFEAIRPHMRRNQRGPGMAAGVEHLAKRWGQTEEDIIGALKECGFTIPEDEDDPPAYVEYDGDLYWVNRNRRGELWINTKEKPRPVFRTVKGNPVAPEAAEGASGEGAPAPREESEQPRNEGRNRRGRGREDRAPSEPGEPLPTGPELLEKIIPQMRRNRDGTGISGSLSFLSRALRCSESDLGAAFGAMGLAAPANADEKPAFVEMSGKLWWLNHDHRGQLWINGREESEPAPHEASTGAAPTQDLKETSVLSAVRLLLQEIKTGSFSAEISRLSEQLGRPPGDLLAALTGAGLKIPEKPREKPVFVEHAGEIFWLNKNPKDELWLNAKASKFAEGGGSALGRLLRGRRGRATAPPAEVREL